MTITLLIIGALLVAAGLNDKLGELKRLTGEAFNPSDNSPSFILWALAIFVVGALGYSKQFRSTSNAFLALVIVSMLLAQKGFFDQFMKAIER